MIKGVIMHKIAVGARELDVKLSGKPRGFSGAIWHRGSS